MNERQYSTEIIMSGNGTQKLEVPIQPSAKRVWKLMGDDYVQLPFYSKRAVMFQVGDYIDDELFGKFVLTAPQKGQIDSSSDVYSYDLRFDAYYKILNNYVFCFCVQTNVVNGSSVYARRETEWHYTATLKEQLAEIQKNISALGFTDIEVDTNFTEADIPTGVEAHAMSYSGQHILDALKSICDEWKCEWWATTENGVTTIHVGKCQIQAPTETYELNVNAESISADENNNGYATRVYGYGGTQNVPYSYRKDLVFHVDDSKQVEVVPAEDLDTKVQTTMFFDHSKVIGSDMLLGASDTPPEEQSVDVIHDDYNLTYEGAKHGAGSTKYFEYSTGKVNLNSASLSVGAKYRLSVRVHTGINVVYEGYVSDENIPNVQVDTLFEIIDKDDKIVKKVEYKHLCVFTNMHNALLGYGLANNQRTASHTGVCKDNTGGYEQINLAFTAEVGGQYYLRITRRVHSPEYGAWSYFDDYVEHVFIETGWFNMALYNTPRSFPLYLEYNGEKHRIVFNPNNREPNDEQYTGFVFLQDEVEIDPETFQPDYDKYIEIPTGFGVGSFFHLPKTWVQDQRKFIGLEYVKIPMSWYSDIEDDPSAIKKVGEKRVLIPLELSTTIEQKLYNNFMEIHNGAVQLKNVLHHTEEVVVFDDDFPKEVIKVTSVTAVDKTENINVGDGSDVSFQYKQYKFTLDFDFKTEYLLPGAKLQVKFLSFDEAHRLDNDFEDNGAYKLSGMTFDVEYDSYSNLYTIIRNEDYGAKLPNETLAPVTGDPVLLLGWNPAAITENGMMAQAENNLLEHIIEYLSALREKQYTYTCNMMSDYAFGRAQNEEEYELPKAGLPVIVKYKPLMSSLPFIPSGVTEGMLMKEDAQSQEATIPFYVLGEQKPSRVIGLEFKLDMPWDGMVVTVGESEAYSRIKTIEKKLQKLS